MKKDKHGHSEYRKMIWLHMAIDAAMIAAAFGIAYVLTYFVGWRMDFIGRPVKFAGANELISCGIFTLVMVVCMYLTGCGRSRWRYSSTIDIIRLFIGSGVAMVLLTLMSLTKLMPDVRVSFIIIFWLIAVILLTINRFFNRFLNAVRHFASSRRILPANGTRVLIYGAGYVGRMLAEQLINNPNDGYLPVAVIDDDASKRGSTISGLRVETGRENLRRIIDATQAELIIIAIQAITKKQLKELYQDCVATGTPTKIVPPMVDGKKELSTLAMEVRDVRTEELLGRDEFEVNVDLMNHFICGKTVLVTGGAGSIGSELCRQALKYGCKHLIAFDVTENSVFFLNQEFMQLYDRSRYTLVIGSVRDKAKLKATFDTYRPDVVFHAAAYKHVPMMEFSPVEAIKNNVIGTANVIDQCNDSGVKKFILISTDKAVNPANVMGASKRIAEMVVQTKSRHSATQLAAVRFGNVLGSAGSVVGIFLDQIRKGGPVTLTHRDIKRYFMTIPEACRLVMQAGALATTGEVFVLDMGEPVYIYDLAVDLIKMNGLTPEKDIEIVVTGLRPGEKLFEELNYSSEVCDRTMHKGIFVCRLEDLDEARFAGQLARLGEAAAREDQGLAARRIFEIVPSAYRHCGDGPEGV